MFAKRLLQSLRNTSILTARRSLGKDVALIGVPFSGGQTKPGVEYGPQIMRESGLIQFIENLGREVVDYGDVEIPEYSIQNPELTHHRGVLIKNARACGVVSQRVADLVETAARDDKICLTIGGDHSIATGTLIGHQRARNNVCVVWIDAHNDLNTPRTTLSGNIHGMSLSFVLKGLTPCGNNVPGYEWAKPCIKPCDLVYIGLRDTDPKEFEMTKRFGIPAFSMFDVDRYGIANVIERAIEIINPRGDRPIHISYDIDSIDPFYSPCTGTPVYGGLSLREGIFIGEYINKLGLLGGLDIVEVNPKLGKTQKEADITLHTAICIAEACLGKHRSGYTVIGK